MNLYKRNIWFIIYLAALSAFAAFSTDVYLAAMPTIQKNFHTSAANVQLSLSLFFVGFAIAQLFWGPLSDRIGRKAVIFIGVSIFILGSLLCAWSQNISALIIARIIQSIGACSGIVMAISIIKDSFLDSKEMAKILSVIISVTILAPMIAPIIGSYLLVHVNWQASFYFLSLYGVTLIIGACFIKESHPQGSRKPLLVKQLLPAYLQQIHCRGFLLSVLALSAIFSALFAFISSSSFIYIKLYNLPIHLFGYFFAINASALIVGNMSLSFLKKHFAATTIIFGALLAAVVGSSVMLVAIWFNPQSIWSIVIPCFIVTHSVGILYPELTSQALKHVVAYTGLASSLIGSFRFAVAAAVGSLMGLAITSSALPLAVAMLILNLLTMLFLFFYYRTFKSDAQQSFFSYGVVG